MSERPHPLVNVYRISPIIAAAILSLTLSPHGIDGTSGEEVSIFSAVLCG